jgi:peroxiredoxin
LIHRLPSAALSVALVALPLLAADIPRQSPDLTIPLADGQQVKLSQYRGKVIALEFLLTTCPHCQHTSQVTEKLYKEFGPRGFQPLGVAINDMAKMLVPEYIRNLGLSYPVGYGGRDMAVTFLQHPVMLRMMMPQLVLIDRKGVIRAQYSGEDKFFVDAEKNMRSMIESLLSEPTASKSKRKEKHS